MRWFSVALLAFACAGASSAANYYACDCQSGAEPGCQAGNDANAGTSPSTPWRSFERLAEASQGSACGDSFNLCEGGIFEASGSTHDFAIAADCSSAPRMLRSYDPGNRQNRPRIEISAISTLINVGGFQAGPATRGFTIQGLDLRHRVPSANSRGMYVNRGARNVVIEDVVFDGFGVCLEAGPLLSQTITRNSTFRRCAAHGVIGEVASGSQFIGNTIEDSACLLDPSSCGFQHSFYWSTNNATAGLVIRANTVRRSNRVNGACSGNPMTIRGGNGLVFENNLLDMRDAGGARNPQAPCYAVRFNQNAGDPAVEGCLDCAIRGNRVIDADIGIDVVGASNTVVENNAISLNEPPTSDWCTGMNFSNGGTTGGGPEDQRANAVRVRNNSIFTQGRQAASSGRGCVGIRIGLTEGTGHQAYSNAVLLSESVSGSHCYEYHDASRVAEDNNLCWRSGAGSYANASGAAQSLAQTRASLGGCPGEGNACASREADPAFLSPGAPAFDLSLGAASAARDMGHPQLSASIDLNGTTRPLGVGPDAGAIEFDDGSLAPQAAPVLLID